MIQVKAIEVSIEIPLLSYKEPDDKYDFSELRDFVNSVGKENILSITCCKINKQPGIVYTVFYDDGK